MKLNLLQRAMGMLDVMRGAALPVPTGALEGGERKSVMLGAAALFDEWGSKKTRWSITTMGTMLSEGYEGNEIVYAAVNYKARASTQAPLRAFRGEREHPEALPDDHPLQALLRQPNEAQGWSEFIFECMVFKNVLGEAVIWKEPGSSGGYPAALRILPTQHVYVITDSKKPVWDRGYIKGYAYTENGNMKDALVFPPEDIIHDMFPNPRPDVGGDGMRGRGLSPLAAIARDVDIDNAVTKFLKKFFDSGGLPPIYIKFNFPLDAARMAEVKARFRQQYGGYGNWSDIGVLDDSAEFKRLGFTFQEMGFDDLDERNESRILGPLGVPPILLGTRFGLKRGTYSNYQTALLAFWQDTMTGEFRLSEDEWNRHFGGKGIFLLFDMSSVPAFQQDVKGLAEAAYKLWQMGVPANAALAEVGLELPLVAAGDQGFVSGMVVAVDALEDGTPSPSPSPIDAGGEKAGSPGPGPVDEGEGSQASGTAAKGAIGAAVHKRLVKSGEAALAVADDWEGMFADAAADRFEADKRGLLAGLNELKTAGLRERKSVNWQDFGSYVDRYLTEAGEEWRESFIPLVSGLINDVGGVWAATLGMQFDVRNLRGEAWFDDYMLTFAQPIMQTTSDDIHAMLAQALAEGWSIPQMQDRLGLVFQQYMAGNLSAADFQWLADRMPEYRREMIARTETTRAMNAGAQQLGRDWGVERKEWLATGDRRTRPTHMEANGQVVDIDKPFQVEGYSMMYPGDSSLGAALSEIVMCRCAMLLHPPTS